MKKTLVIGASPKEERYSNKATKLLLEKGHEVQLFGNRVSEIYGQPILKEWEDLDLKELDTVPFMWVRKINQNFIKRS